MNRYGWMLTLTLTMGLLTAGCDSHQRVDADTPTEHQHVNMWESVNEAVAVIHPTRGNNARGTVRFQQRGNLVRVIADVQGLQPNSTHGFHIHQYGDCTAPDATSAGGHYNPDDHPHAGPDAQTRHAGDLGNLESDAQGRASKEMLVDNISVAGVDNPVIGRAVIVHAQRDDLQSQPTGDAGARLGCGVIGIANPSAR